jgi:glycosyltransferase involved in cell wall biosynthesis
MPNVVIVQRVVPSYRLPVYQRLWEEFGWVVAYGHNLGTEGMSLQQKAPFLKGFTFSQTRFGMIKVPITKIIETLRPDAIIAEGALRMSSTWELIARRKFFGEPKLYFWSIGYNATKGLASSPTFKKQWIYPTAFRNADGCLTYGEDGQAFLSPRMGGKPVFVAHNSIDMDAIRNFRDSTPALPRRGFPELVSVSRLTVAKEYVKLVEAFQIIRQSYPLAQLTIIGEGPDRKAIEIAAGSELGASIHLTGALYDEHEIAAYMNRADAFVIAGRVGLSINHALGYDLPVICFSRGTNGPFHGSEITHLKPGITGYFVEDYDADSFADTVVSIFKNKPNLRESHRDPIRSYVDEFLSIDRMLGGFRKVDAHIRATSAIGGAAAVSSG